MDNTIPSEHHLTYPKHGVLAQSFKVILAPKTLVLLEELSNGGLRVYEEEDLTIVSSNFIFISADDIACDIFKQSAYRTSLGCYY